MNLQIVFSRCPEGVPEDEFNAWYDEHLAEILSIPGFMSAQRYRLDPVVVDPDWPSSYGFLAVYETGDDTEALMAEMEKANLTTKDSYTRRKDEDASGPALPDWWDRVRFASWNCISLGGRVEMHGTHEVTSWDERT